MNPVTILDIIEVLAQIIPELAALFTKPATIASDVNAILSKYGVDQMVLTAAIATAKAKGG